MSDANPDFFAELLNSLAANVAIFDLDFNLIWHNHGFARFVSQFHSGKPAVSLSGANLLTLWPNIRHILEPHLQHLQAGEPVYKETINIRRGGAETYWDADLLARTGDDGRSQFLLIMHEVTPHILSYQGLERRMADRMRKLKALYDILQVAGQAADLPAMAAQALRRVLTAVRALVGMIHLLDESGRQLQLLAQHGLIDGMMTPLTIIPADDGLAGQVLKQKSPVIVPDIQADPSAQPVFCQSGLKAYAGVTLRVKGKIIGVLGAFWEEKRPFHPEDIELLASAADQIAVAIETHRLRQKAEQLAVMEERTRLARDLHDSVSQALYSMSLLAAAGRRLSLSGRNQPLLEETLLELGTTAQQALKEMRLLLYRLRPLALQLDGLAETLRHRLDAVEKRAGIDAQLIIGNLPPLLPALEETLYHIAQEALNNALKHASATAVTVQLTQEPDSAVQLVVADNGRGFNLVEALEQGGMGLANMRQRAESHDGTLTVDSVPGQGTTITAQVFPGGEQ